MSKIGKIALFVGGTLFGSAGLRLLGSKDAIYEGGLLGELL